MLFKNKLIAAMVFRTFIRYSARTFDRWRPKNIDSLYIHVKGGQGGNGMPDLKGIGGQGGNVILVCKENATLERLAKMNPSRKYVAARGRSSRRYDLVGSRGPDLHIEVPPGVTAISQAGANLGSFNKPEDTAMVALGGTGGNFDNNYIGQPGCTLSLTLDLKLLADVGLVGFPNAGKSTLLKALSRAKPKIANYPFTTVTPNLGVIEYPDLRQISVADLPGLVEGAHANIGLGHRFLKHIVRTKLLLFVVDVTGFQLRPSEPYRTPIENVLLLNQELAHYQEWLLDKPAILVVNKMDLGLKENRLLFEELRHKWKHIDEVSETLPEELRSSRYIYFHDIIPTVAARSGGIPILKQRIQETIDFYHMKKPVALLEAPTSKYIDII